MALLRCLIASKKECLVQNHREAVRKSRVAHVTERKTQEIKRTVADELRDYIHNEVLPIINFIECG
jgi:hypothetical protein